MIVHYQGEARDGGARVGRHIEVGPVAEFVESRFRNGWRWLVVVIPADGERLGEIFFDASQGRRTWWAEGCDNVGQSVTPDRETT